MEVTQKVSAMNGYKLHKDNLREVKYKKRDLTREINTEPAIFGMVILLTYFCLTGFVC